MLKRAVLSTRIKMAERGTSDADHHRLFVTAPALSLKPRLLIRNVLLLRLRRERLTPGGLPKIQR